MTREEFKAKEYPDSEGKPSYRYSCKHLLGNGDCGAYETRPGMCKDFPYGRACSYDECTWKSAEQSSQPGQYKSFEQ